LAGVDAGCWAETAFIPEVISTHIRTSTAMPNNQGIRQMLRPCCGNFSHSMQTATCSRPVRISVFHATGAWAQPHRSRPNGQRHLINHSASRTATELNIRQSAVGLRADVHL
jgi:hypothetical protein